ncbi:MAG: large conductance mechanosensitive channel protein MscL [Actinomycetes bacterium]|jgi:large conductance mechanosensitive channel|nr:large conductance mechanosensitive channel protein MscL [Acidimicrobiia bacterium]
MIREFREFIARGNIVELAVAFIMGVAFSDVVTTFTDRIVNPVIGLILPGLDNLEGLGTFADGGSIGAFIGSVINFLLVALVLFFIVKAYNRFKRGEPEEPEGPSEEIVLLTEIRDALRTTR